VAICPGTVPELILPRSEAEVEISSGTVPGHITYGGRNNIAMCRI